MSGDTNRFWFIMLEACLMLVCEETLMRTSLLLICSFLLPTPIQNYTEIGDRNWIIRNKNSLMLSKKVLDTQKYILYASTYMKF